MLRARDFRKAAWEKLSGKRGVTALITLLSALIYGACSSLNAIKIGSVALLIIGGPLALGLAEVALNVVRRNDVKVEQTFSGFKSFGKAFCLYVINGVFVFLWSLLFIIPGIIKSLSYSMSYYVMLDNPELSANEARKKSMEIMDGNKWRLFCLNLSFIGWMLLSILTLGILFFWTKPYFQTAQAEFYESIKNNA